MSSVHSQIMIYNVQKPQKKGLFHAAKRSSIMVAAKRYLVSFKCIVAEHEISGYSYSILSVIHCCQRSNLHPTPKTRKRNENKVTD